MSIPALQKSTLSCIIMNAVVQDSGSDIEYSSLVINQQDMRRLSPVLFSLGLHLISASASAKPKFGHFSQIRLRLNIWPNLADANATAVRSVSYLITGKN